MKEDKMNNDDWCPHGKYGDGGCDICSQPLSSDAVLGEVLYKQVTYKITIEKTKDFDKIPVELREDFLAWIQAKAIELGLGRHYEYYYDHDETGKKCVGVGFIVHCT
jgi:hypothetical protein